MMERMLVSTLNTTILSLIALTGGGALFLGYLGLADLFNGQAGNGTCALFAAMAPGLASLKLCWYRNDLVGR